MEAREGIPLTKEEFYRQEKIISDAVRAGQHIFHAIHASAFENSLSGNKETTLFFCDPNASYQKPHVENNHSLFRFIIPKGNSFDNFTQDTVDLIFSHVNGVLRKQFNGKSAYDMFTFTYSEKLASALGISRVESQDVVQSPLLLR